jgi:hypothetical protein
MVRISSRSTSFSPDIGKIYGRLIPVWFLARRAQETEQRRALFNAEADAEGS